MAPKGNGASAKAAKQPAPVADVQTKEEDVKKEEDEQEKPDIDMMAKKEEECVQPKDAEAEEDAAADRRPKLRADSVAVDLADATLNVMPASQGSLLMCLNGGGMQYLLASARANVGLKNGRYMFEARIVEMLTPVEEQTYTRSTMPKQFVRFGFSLKSSSIFLAESDDSVCFDSEGFFSVGRKKSKAGRKFGKDQTVALVLNLVSKTVSLFLDGERASEPQLLPENLQDKALYPTFTYRNMTLRLNFGPSPMVPLPFRCRMVQDAAVDDVEVAPSLPNTKPEVVFPVGLPDKGVFDWADQFLEKNPSYEELSDRKLVEWAIKSQLGRPKGAKRSNDEPDFNFGFPTFDDRSATKVLANIAPMLGRNFLVMELANNLVASSRADSLRRFAGSSFKKTAVVCLGEPDTMYKDNLHKQLLAEKQAKAELERKKKEVEAVRRKQLEEKRKKAEESRKLRELAEKRKRGDDGAEAGAEEKEAEVEVEVEEEGKANEMEDIKPEVVELTDEEKKAWYRKSDTPDMTEDALARLFADFSIPTREEGFDEVRFVWRGEGESFELLRDFVLEQKKTQKVHDIIETEWFKEHLLEWHKDLQAWRACQREWKDPAKRTLLLKQKVADEKEKVLAMDPDASFNEEAKLAELEGFDQADVDPMGVKVEDVTDIGGGAPLFSKFSYEDWALLTIRVELHMLVHAFRKALGDPDRCSFSEAHLNFYYDKFFKKEFTPQKYGFETFKEFNELIKDTIVVNQETGKIEAIFEDDTSNVHFVGLTEVCRREREFLVDAGDETARLKFPPPSQQGEKQASAGSRQALKPIKRPPPPMSANAPSYSGVAVKRSRPDAYGAGEGAGAGYGAPSRYGGVAVGSAGRYMLGARGR